MTGAVEEVLSLKEGLVGSCSFSPAPEEELESRQLILRLAGQER